MGVGNDGVLLCAAFAEVVLLEVAGYFVEPIPVDEIMVRVDCVEELRNAGVDVGFRRNVLALAVTDALVAFPSEWKREVEVGSLRTMVELEEIAAGGVVLSEDVVSTRVCHVGTSPSIQVIAPSGLIQPMLGHGI